MSDNIQRGSNVQVVNRPEPKDNKKRNVLIVLVVLLLLAALGIGGWYMLNQPEEQEEMIITDQIQPTNTPQPTPTEEPIERSEVSIQVLNGTGIAGEAGLLQEELEELGYEDIEVANANEEDYEAAEVTFDEGLPASVVEEITQALESFYVDVEIVTESLDDFDVIIITGDREGMARTTATPTPTTSNEDETTATSTPAPSPSQ